MSRSYKKNPVNKFAHGNIKFQKKIATHKVRRKLNKIENEEVGNNGNYKRHYEQWEICDMKSIWTKKEAIALYKKWTDPNSIKYDPNYKETEQEFLRWWRKLYKNK